MDKKLYPKNWTDISLRIRFERAGNCCEWCGVPNYAWRDASGQYVTLAQLESLKTEDLPVDLTSATRIILTVAHLGIDKPDGTPGNKSDTMDCREENLAALCQRCHLNFDRSDNINRRRINRRKNDDELRAMASIGDAFAGFTEEAYGNFIEKYVDAPLSAAQNSTQLAT